MSKKSHRRSTKNIRRKTYRGGVKLRDIATAALLMSNPTAAKITLSNAGRISSKKGTLNKLKGNYIKYVSDTYANTFNILGRTTGSTDITDKLKQKVYKVAETLGRNSPKPSKKPSSSPKSSPKRSSSRSPSPKSSTKRSSSHKSKTSTNNTNLDSIISRMGENL